ncbi:unnamed protein product [Phytomonas sp. Hart1]|nr:unnamed protein product [Phytomonas sp. Hart1]|eukprot:CCW71921.1 unnamed protein product [Phytomonas sp. isolate Hart1]
MSMCAVPDVCATNVKRISFSTHAFTTPLGFPELPIGITPPPPPLSAVLRLKREKKRCCPPVHRCWADFSFARWPPSRRRSCGAGANAPCASTSRASPPPPR